MRNEPLGLPKGSIRAIIALLIVVTTVVAIFVDKEVFSVLFPIAGTIVGYYFGRRSLR